MSNPHRYRLLVVGLMSAGLLAMAAAPAWADDESIFIDLVRHGESVANAAGILDTAPPGAELNSTGLEQATAVATAIQNEYGTNIAGLFASEAIRAQGTAAPLAEALSSLNNGDPYPIDILSGLNEIPAGSFEGGPAISLEGMLYLLGPISWALGLPLVPNFGDPSMNGITFDQDFSQAVQAIYDGTVGTGVGTTNDIAFSSEGAIAVWTLMNVNNPDFSVLFHELLTYGELLPNTGQVVIEGSPGDWTLVSYDGVAISQDPGLATELFVDFRNLIEVPQLAAYDIYEALLTGNTATIDSAIQTGITQIDAALAQFPVEVFDEIIAALGGSV
jgi:hypothetical protein